MCLKPFFIVELLVREDPFRFWGFSLHLSSIRNISEGLSRAALKSEPKQAVSSVDQATSPLGANNDYNKSEPKRTKNSVSEEERYSIVLRRVVDLPKWVSYKVHQFCTMLLSKLCNDTFGQRKHSTWIHKPVFICGVRWISGSRNAIKDATVRKKIKHCWWGRTSFILVWWLLVPSLKCVLFTVKKSSSPPYDLSKYT